MRKIIMYYSSLLFVLLIVTQVKAQSKIGINIGTAIPIADFASGDITNEKSGGASTGFNVGLIYNYPISEKGLGLFAAIDFNFNSLQSDVKNDIKAEIGSEAAHYSFYSYYNIPISFGPTYSFELGEQIKFFLNIGATFNILKMSDLEIKRSTEESLTEFDTATNFGYKMGCGLVFMDKISVCINYMDLGKHEVSGDMSEGGLLFEKVKFEQDIKLITFTLGYCL